MDVQLQYHPRHPLAQRVSAKPNPSNEPPWTIVVSATSSLLSSAPFGSNTNSRHLVEIVKYLSSHGVDQFDWVPKCKCKFSDLVKLTAKDLERFGVPEPERTKILDIIKKNGLKHCVNPVSPTISPVRLSHSLSATAPPSASPGMSPAPSPPLGPTPAAALPKTAATMKFSNSAGELKNGPNHTSPTNATYDFIFMGSMPLYEQDENEFLEIDEEMTHFKRLLEESGRKFKVRFEVATKSTFFEVISRQSKVLHFSGHGKPGFLTIEDDTGGVLLLKLDQLKESLSRGQTAPRLVVLSSCSSSSIAESFLEAGSAHVVSVKEGHSVSDSAAISFMRNFYTSLSLGSKVIEAFKDGCRTLAVSERGERDRVFQLLPEGAAHDDILFPEATVQRGSCSFSAHVSPNNLLALPRRIVGRQNYTRNVIASLAKSRLVVVSFRWCVSEMV
jgi:hypothetical protein